MHMTYFVSTRQLQNQVLNNHAGVCFHHAAMSKTARSCGAALASTHHSQFCTAFLCKIALGPLLQPTTAEDVNKGVLPNCITCEARDL